MRIILVIFGAMLMMGLTSAASISTDLSHLPPVEQGNLQPYLQEGTPPPDTDPGLPATPTGSAPTQTSSPASPTVIEFSGFEPRRFQQLEGGSLSIYGAGFPAGASIRLIGYGILETSVLSSQALQCVVPPGLRTGKYELELLLPAGASISHPWIDLDPGRKNNRYPPAVRTFCIRPTPIDDQQRVQRPGSLAAWRSFSAHPGN